MEEKLAAYRARKAKEKEAENSLLNRIWNPFSMNMKIPNEHSQSTENSDVTKLGDNTAMREDERESSSSTTSENETQSTSIYWCLTGLKFLLWLCIWGIFIELQFGAVFFTISLMCFVYFNTRSGKTDKNLSAYSVFNKNCERIQGTLTAEKMQQDMFRVPGLPS